jgi:tRNA (guanine37-N1)-methyltransferase
MLAAATELKNAQKVKESLMKQGVINTNYLSVKELGLIYFPIIKKVKVTNAEVKEVKFSFPQKEHALTVEELLKGKLTDKEMKLLPKSQEVIGKILILEIPPELEKKEKIIAEAYLKATKNLETVVKKHEIHSGVYRTRKVKVLAGKNQKETIHGENGVRMWVNLEETYFSARSATERLRIAHQVKKGEEVLVMFSGVGPFVLVVAKNSPAAHVYGIEINPQAHQLALKNIVLNNAHDRAFVHEGDVRVLVPELFAKKKFDRIVMPLPKTGEEFLDVALSVANKGTIIHLYAFLAEEEVAAHKKRINKICTSLKQKVKILEVVKCGQFAPNVFRMCFDIKVEK